jgi:hypothetical protein
MMLAHNHHRHHHRHHHHRRHRHHHHHPCLASIWATLQMSPVHDAKRGNVNWSADISHATGSGSAAGCNKHKLPPTPLQIRHAAAEIVLSSVRVESIITAVTRSCPFAQEKNVRYVFEIDHHDQSAFVRASTDL